MRQVLRFAPPVLWMALIAVMSGDAFGSERTGAWLLPLLARALPGTDPGVLHGLHAVLRKMGHVVEYGVLAGLWLRGLRPGPRAALLAVLLAAAYAVFDELRQTLAVTRTASALDVLLDAAGALVAVGCLEGRGSLTVLGLRLARWAALAVVAGSLAAAGLDWSLGLDARDLVLAAAGAGVAAWALGRLGRGGERG
jgi:VanZ family protein